MHLKLKHRLIMLIHSSAYIFVRKTYKTKYVRVKVINRDNHQMYLFVVFILKSI